MRMQDHPAARVIFWDFDGTLAFRPKMWTHSMRMVLDEYEGGHGIEDASLMQWLSTGFPWQEPGKEHHHLTGRPDLWWEGIYPAFERAFAMNGFSMEKSRRYAREVRKHLIAPEHYRLFDDAADTLRAYRENGYRNIILSNHLPELPDIARSLGLMEHVEYCITSASVGYEKPNAAIFRLAYEMAGRPETVWMVGDNADADVSGAEAAGIRAILVHKPPKTSGCRFSPDLKGTAAWIRGAEEK